MAEIFILLKGCCWGAWGCLWGERQQQLLKGLSLYQGQHTEGGPMSQGSPLKEVRRQFHQGECQRAVWRQKLTHTAKQGHWQWLWPTWVGVGTENYKHLINLTKSPEFIKFPKTLCPPSHCSSLRGLFPLLFWKRPSMDTLPLWAHHCPSHCSS